MPSASGVQLKQGSLNQGGSSIYVNGQSCNAAFVPLSNIDANLYTVDVIGQHNYNEILEGP